MLQSYRLGKSTRVESEGFVSVSPSTNAAFFFFFSNSSLFSPSFPYRLHHLANSCALSQGVGERCYRGTPEWVDVKPSPGETPENVPEETPETAPQEPAFPTVEPIDWGELLRLWPLIPWPNLSPAGGAG